MRSLHTPAKVFPEALLANNTTGEIQDRVSSTCKDLRRIIHDYLEDDPDLLKLVEKLAAEGADAVQWLAKGNRSFPDKKENLLESLEVIVDLEGNLPSCLIRDFKPDADSSMASRWDKDYWVAAQNTLGNAIRCVGRIEVLQPDPEHIGTGFLVAPDVIMTNHHVLQAIANELPGNSWRFKAETRIDFGREFKGVASYNSRELEKVIFCPALLDAVPETSPCIDLVLISLKPGKTPEFPPLFLPIVADEGWLSSGEELYVIGYPGKPAGGRYAETLLERLFHSTFGYKRIAPGFLMPPEVPDDDWTIAYNATTLGGNSGSLILHKKRGGMAAGIHFGGQHIEPRQNYGYLLARTLQARDKVTGRSLKEIMKVYQIPT